jgi:hypothetical protein
MKKIIILFFTLCLTSLAIAQDGAEHKITKIVAPGKVEINIGEQYNIQINDVFQIFGKAQVIHPATGKLVERDNVYLGKIKVVEVKELSSIAEILEESEDFAVGNKIIKVVSEETEVVENKKPVQTEFENPTRETILKQYIPKNQKNRKVNQTILAYMKLKSLEVIHCNAN